MKSITTNRVLGAGAALLLSCFLGGATFAQGPAVNVKAGKFETAREKNALKAFRMKAGYKGDVEARELGNKLFRAARFNDSVQLKDDNANHMIHVGRTDPSSHFRIDKTTGDFSFSKGMKEYMTDKEVMGLPTKDKAVELAKKHLSDLGLMPEKQEEMVLRHVGGLKQVDVTEDGKVHERDKLVTVHFGRQIDGIDVGGPGSKIVVELGANGELVSLAKRWIEVNEEKKSEGDFALQLDITNKLKEKLRKDAAKARSVDSEAPAFGLYDDGAGNIEPAYFFIAELNYDLEEQGGKHAHNEKYLGVVPALKSSKGKFDQEEKAKLPPGQSKAVEKDEDPVKD